MTLLTVGLLTFFLFVRLDAKLDKEVAHEAQEIDDKFRTGDIFSIFRIRGFWYIAILCLLFYSAVFPFMKFATEFMIVKFNVDPKFAGTIPSLLPVGTLLLTPLFGGVYDKKGHGATIMLVGAVLLVFVYSIFAIPNLNFWLVAVGLMLILGVAFSLVPSAMWPSVAKIMPLSKLGTAYALVFWFQNWGLAGVPLLVGWALDKYGRIETISGEQSYDYTQPILIFLILSSLAVFFALLLKREDRIRGYGLQEPNIKG
jgi:MFS family permease